MLLPKRVKYRKMHRGRRKGIATRGATVAFGDFGLQAMEACWMSNRQIEAARRAMTRHVKRGGQIWIRVFPDKSITKKPAETRMGSGKGNPEGWVAVVKPGRVLFEMGGVTQEIAKEAMKLAAAGILVQLLAVTAGGLDYLILVRSQPFRRQALYVGGSNRIDFEDIRFDPSYSQIVGNWILLRYLLHLPPAPGRPGVRCRHAGSCSRPGGRTGWRRTFRSR